MTAKFVHNLEIKSDDSKEEKVFVETMFSLFSFHWMLFTAMNFLLASDPFLEGQSSRSITDFLIGAIMGVNIVILIE